MEVRQHLNHLQQSPHTIEAKDVKAGKGSSQEGKGPGVCLSVIFIFFIFCKAHGLVVSRGNVAHATFFVLKPLNHGLIFKLYLRGLDSL